MSMPVFDIVVVGCGGGPSEHNLSSYLLKPSNARWCEGVIALEAGSGLGALTLLLRNKPDLFGTRAAEDGTLRPYTAPEVYSWIRSYLITHAHLDHVASLVLSAGSMGGSRRHVFGTQSALEDLQNIFNDRLWPKLASWNPEPSSVPLLLNSLSPNDLYTCIFPDISVCIMPVSHGENDSCGIYDSSAYFIRHDPSARELLFFGDVEPDSVSSKPLNVHVWRAAASKVPHTLATIFIECSWPLGRTQDTLYGHLSPEHLAAEITVLAREVIEVRRAKMHASVVSKSSRARKKQRRNPVAQSSLRDALDGVRIYITHCKDDLQGIYNRPINQVIADQVRELLDGPALGAEVIAVDQGMQIVI